MGLRSCSGHCNELCHREKNINATYILELNSKCSSCEISLNIDEYRCIGVVADLENEALCIIDKLCNRDYKIIIPHVPKIRVHSTECN